MSVAALARRSDGDLPHTIPGLKLWLDARRPRNYDCLHLPGSAGYYASTPDSAAVSITGDIDIRARIAPTTWSASSSDILSKELNSVNRGFHFQLSGKDLYFIHSTAAAPSVQITAQSSVVVPFSDGQAGWVRATMDVDNGASGHDVTFYTAADSAGVPSSWTQLGTVQTTAGTTDINDNTNSLDIGCRQAGASLLLPGRYYRIQMLNGINGTVAFDADFTNKGYTFTESSVNAATVTCNGRAPLNDGDPLSIWCDMSGNANDVVQATAAKKPVYRTATTTGYLTLPGVAGNYASAPDSAATSVTGDIDIRCRVALADWTPSATTALLAKYMNTGNQRSYRLEVTTSGVIQLFISLDGATFVQYSSTAANTVTDGVTKWVRATRVSATGVTKFYLSDDGSSWTQLGTDVAGTAGAIYDSTQLLEVGSLYSGTTEAAAGKFYRAQIRNNILDDGTGIVFDADFTTTGRSFAESSANAARVTINGDQARESVSTIPSIIFDGVDDFLQGVPWALAQPTTRYVVWSTTNNALTQHILSSMGVTRQDFYMNANTSVGVYAGAALTNAAIPSNGAVCVTSAIANTTSSSLSFNGTVASPGNAGTQAWDAPVLSSLAGTSAFFVGSIVAALVYQGAHDANTRKRIERWLGRQYAVTIAQ